MEDHEIIAWAKQAYESGSGGNIIVDEPGVDNGGMDAIVDRLDDESAAWVRAWVYVPIVEGEEDGH